MHRTALIALAAGLLTPAAAAQQFWNLGAGFTPTDGNFDGSVVVGQSQAIGQGFVWTAADGIVGIGGESTVGQFRITDDGTRIAGTRVNPASGNREMSIYDRTTGQWTALGGIGGVSDGSASSAWGMSRNGQHVVGLGWVTAGRAHAIRWDEGSGLTDMGSTVADRSSRANGVSDDGTVVAGWQDGPSGFRQGAVWVNGSQTLIFNNNGQEVSEAGAISADGQWVIGNGAGGQNAWRWSQSSGYQDLGALGVIFNGRGFATDVNADGSVILGFERGFGFPTGGEGWIWTETGGMTSLNDYFASFGVVADPGFRFSLPLGMSSDGLTFWGMGRSDSAFSTGWIVTIPTPGTAALLGFGALAGIRRRR
ncbi:MAG: hypothetical protein LAT64_14700 [Phycisphaerales bacterium]|nr:hypothetical protein [Phycisphaerales bacterium]